MLDYSKESEAVKRCLKGKLKQLDDKDVLLKYEPSINLTTMKKLKVIIFLRKLAYIKTSFLFASRSSSFYIEENLVS